MTPAIEIRNVVKNYGSVAALAGISFDVASGELFGLLGPNGAGKSTLIRIVSTLEEADGGTVRVGGDEAGRGDAAIRAQLGVALQETGIDPLMSGYEILLLTGRLYGLSAPQAKQRTDELLTRFRLTEAARRLVRTYSGGMRRRLDLAVALVHEPSVIVLDEPTTGLDPTNRLALWALLRDLVKEDHKTLLLTTQYLEEADALCDRVLFIDHGRSAAEGTPDDLKRAMGYSLIQFTIEGAELGSFAAALQRAQLVPQIQGGRVQILSLEPEVDVLRLDAAATANGVRLRHLEIKPPSLDDVFLRLTAGDREEVNSIGH